MSSSLSLSVGFSIQDEAIDVVAVVVVIAVVVEASAPKVYPRVTLASASLICSEHVRKLKRPNPS